MDGGGRGGWWWWWVQVMAGEWMVVGVGVVGGGGCRWVGDACGAGGSLLPPTHTPRPTPPPQVVACSIKRAAGKALESKACPSQPRDASAPAPQEVVKGERRGGECGQPASHPPSPSPSLPSPPDPRIVLSCDVGWDGTTWRGTT